MTWFLHFTEQSDPPKAGDIVAVCGQEQKDVVPVYGEAGEEFRVCPKCEVQAVNRDRRFRSYAHIEGCGRIPSPQGAEMSNFLYIGTKPCGCRVALVVDEPKYPKDTAETVSEMIQAGYTISRETREQYAANGYLNYPNCNECKEEEAKRRMS